MYIMLSTRAKIKYMIIIGLWGASLSSALGSLLGAPQTLLALAKDRIAPSFLGRKEGKEQQPRNALIATVLIAVGGIFIGDFAYGSEYNNTLTLFNRAFIGPR